MRQEAKGVAAFDINSGLSVLRVHYHNDDDTTKYDFLISPLSARVNLCLITTSSATWPFLDAEGGQTSCPLQNGVMCFLLQGARFGCDSCTSLHFSTVPAMSPLCSKQSWCFL